LGDRIKGARVILLDALRTEIASHVIEGTPAPKTARLFDGAKAVKLTNASADFAQSGFEATDAIDGNERSGWGFAGGTGVAHAMVVECKPVITLESNTELSTTLGSAIWWKSHAGPRSH
jgi:hypothetical protein